MPVCEGLPDGPCPQRRSDKSVKIGKGDLLLCPSCDTERRRLFDQSKKADEAAKQTRSTRNTGVPISSSNIETTAWHRFDVDLLVTIDSNNHDDQRVADVCNLLLRQRYCCRFTQGDSRFLPTVRNYRCEEGIAERVCS